MCRPPRTTCRWTQLLPSVDPPDSGAGVRFMWYPGKAAFRAGQVVRQRWNNANIGNHSVAMGFDPVASGDSSFAVGSNAAARGNHSVAIGSGARAEGNYSFALGRYAVALDDGVVFLADSTGTPDGVVLGMPNTFFANFAGGYRLRSGSGGVRLDPRWHRTSARRSDSVKTRRRSVR